MILRIDNPISLNPIFRLEKYLGHSRETFQSMLIRAVADQDSVVLVDKADGVVRGYMFASIERIDDSPCVFIHLTYARPDARGVAQGLLGHVTKMARSLGIQHIYMTTKRSPKAFDRAYGFKFHRYLMRKEVI